MRRRYISAAAWHRPRRDRDSAWSAAFPARDSWARLFQPVFCWALLIATLMALPGVMLLRDGIERRDARLEAMRGGCFSLFAAVT